MVSSGVSIVSLVSFRCFDSFSGFVPAFRLFRQFRLRLAPEVSFSLSVYFLAWCLLCVSMNQQFLSVALYHVVMLLILAYLDGSRIFCKRYITRLARGLIEKKEPVMRSLFIYLLAFQQITMLWRSWTSESHLYISSPNKTKKKTKKDLISY